MTDHAEPPTVVLASRNADKQREIAELLAPYGIRILPVSAFPDAPDVVEDGCTFAENAAKKAGETARALAHWTLGEDSGLMVEALDGAPGIYSARFSGDDATGSRNAETASRNNEKLRNELADVPAEKRGACYVCHAALADPSGRIRVQAEAACQGRITTTARGRNGFGYDPYFLIPEYHRTFGELSGLVKRHLSHRARAFARLIPQLVAVLRSDQI